MQSDDKQLEKGHSVTGHQEADMPTERKGGLGPKLEADYNFFVDVMWANISTKEEKQTMTPALVYQEICSFLKGSSEAMDSPGGRLTLQGYLDVGRKRAPKFNADTRREVYPIFERYEREKLRLNRYDHMDLLFHIYHSLKTNGYQGVPIHNITRDEVQDFTQAELLVDLRTMCDANGLFCCGDPCQTIARGIVFRFADICTLFHHESQRRKDAGGIVAATIVGVPKKLLHLPTNYRTHSGILNAAAAVVDVLRQYFPMHIDNLAREKAFFKGPPPLLLSSTSPDDLTFLLLGSDPKTSQVEFGAHQLLHAVILGRTADSLDSLPQHLLDSNVIKMTVAQAKGLEFDDVFLWDFFNGSPAEWRPLNNYVAHLAEVEETQGPRKLPAGTPLVDVEVDAIDKGALRVARSADQHDVLLCEELKYLYTALTRAKNNVIIFDSNTAKRAPFFNYLRRLGMAQYVSRSVMEDHTDDSRYVLTQGKNSSQDWVARGYNFMDNRLYDLAAHCFKVAEDAVRFTVATAFGKYLALKSKKSNVPPTESMQETFKIGHDLLTAAGRADEATSAVKLTERKNWLNIAAKMFRSTSEGKHIAARLFRELGNFKAAVAISTHLNDFAAAAETCVKSWLGVAKAYLHLIETVSAVTLLSLGAFTFLPDLYVDCLEWSPLMGQAGSRGRVNQGGRRVAALKRLQYKSDGVPSALKLLTRAVRLLHHLMKTIVADKISFQSRSLLVTSVDPLPGEVGADDQEACQESAAACMAILAVTLLTAFAINASPDADVKELIRATWRVVHMAEGCIQDASMLQALQACRQAAKVGEMLPALLQVSYRLSSGLTEVSVDRQVRALLALANATCIPYTADKLKAPAGDVRKLLLMPDEKEVASFTASTDTGAKLAAAALFIQEEWRAYRHRQLVAAKIRWLRASRLWREKFHSWTLSMRAKKRLQKETEAVAALEERRKQYQANAQQRLAWVEEGLSQRLTEDSTCPVCRSDAGKKAAAAKSRLAEGSDAEDEDEEDEDDEDDEEQSGNNPFAALAGLQKAANAAPFVPHTQRQYHEASLRAFQSYKHFYTDQDHTTHLASLLDHMRTLVQETNRWLQADEAKEAVPDSSVQADTSQKHVRGDAKPDATRGSPAKEQAAGVFEHSWDEEEDDILGDDDFTLVVKKKKKRGAGKGPARRRL
ncbi:hypothetical protein WJX82_004398 [Trebouxia sp. C0006]